VTTNHVTTNTAPTLELNTLADLSPAEVKKVIDAAAYLRTLKLQHAADTAAITHLARKQTLEAARIKAVSGNAVDLAALARAEAAEAKAGTAAINASKKAGYETYIPKPAVAPALSPRTVTDNPDDVRVYEYILQSLHNKLTNTYSSAHNFATMLYDTTDPLLDQLRNITFNQLSAFIIYEHQAAMIFMNPDGTTDSDATIAHELMTAAYTASHADVPSYRPMTIEPTIVSTNLIYLPDDPEVDFEPPPNYQGDVAHPWQFIAFRDRGTNYQHSSLLRNNEGYPSKVLSAATPLHKIRNYLWKDTYIGEPRQAMNLEYALYNYSRDNYNVGFIAIYDPQSELYLGSRDVSYNITHSTVNTVYSGAENITVIVPPSVTSIPDNAFCSSDGEDGLLPFNITSITYSSILTNIGSNAFKNSNPAKFDISGGSTTTYTSLQNPTYLDPGSSFFIYIRQGLSLNVTRETSRVVVTMSPGNNLWVYDYDNNKNYNSNGNLLYAVFDASGYELSMKNVIVRDEPYDSINIYGNLTSSGNTIISYVPYYVMTLTPYSSLHIKARRPTMMVQMWYNDVSPMPRAALSSAVIGDNAFSYNNTLSTITFPDNCCSIGSGAFSFMTQLRQITLPDTMTSIGDEAFANSAIQLIKIPASLTTVGINLFLNNAPLQVIVDTIPPALTGIAEQLPACSIIFTTSETNKDAIITSLLGISTQALAVLVDTPPAAPLDLSGSPLDGGILLSWAPADPLNGSVIESYTLVMSGVEIENITSPYTLRELTNMKSYTLRIIAKNASGLVSPPSEPILVTPMPISPPFTDLITESPYALYTADITILPIDQGIVNGWLVSDAPIRIYGPATDYTISDKSFTLSNIVTGRYCILTSTPSSSIALQTYTGQAISLTLVKLGDKLNRFTKHISCADTGLQVFTVNGIPVIHGDTITLRNCTNPAIVVTPNDPDATVILQGATGLTEGLNDVTVQISASDRATTDFYTITIQAFLNTYSRHTANVLQAVMTEEGSLQQVIRFLMADINQNPEGEEQILTCFLEDAATSPAAIPLILEVASQFAAKSLTNAALLQQGLTPNLPYDLNPTLTSRLLSQIPEEFRDDSYSPSTLALLLPDATNHIVVDMAQTDILLSLVPGIPYKMSAALRGIQSTTNSTVTYVRTESERYLMVDDTPSKLILFTFPDGRQRYLLLQAFGSPMGSTGILMAHMEPNTTITLSPAVASIRIGARATITARIRPESIPVIWTSNSPCVSVNQSGVITAVGKGTAIVTASSIDGSVRGQTVLEVVPN
jgi:hypothetical protein